MSKKIILLVSLFIFSSCSLLPKNQEQNINLNQTTTNPMTTDAPTQTAVNTPATETESVVALKTKNGQIVIRLYKKEAPNTVANFLKKVQSGFYNGLTFHRVEPAFVVQGGDPLGNGTGGGKIASEINAIPFRRGSVGLARGPVKAESNDSQFYICLADEACSHLTNEYVNFGEVISGLDVVDKIAVGDKIIEATVNTK